MNIITYALFVYGITIIFSMLVVGVIVLVNKVTSGEARGDE